MGLDGMGVGFGRRPVALHGQYSAESIGRRRAEGGAEGWWAVLWARAMGDETRRLDATGGSEAVHGP